MLTDAFQPLQLRALKKLYENWLMDQNLSIYFSSDQDAMILDELVFLEDAGTETTKQDDREKVMYMVDKGA
ncbi:uncharacterized protein ANIA_11559 [Aspergillus nidulans FGSC A4]|uniref:Uncharacterized protein n=1 Tax=Emericella nidulans (strain FGSC A4 / ATCC 38163 / CBS 112.46 / NRRL 194 / M139) TaxID=227321 RepID=C8VCC5_EMENI|nr:hypothetical protein [Aspergillus nidulans FGSC A4]CBF78420.1 TPA: hypothetical protein ANIA_11559 [Aspergillus nidulans FGSC A4]